PTWPCCSAAGRTATWTRCWPPPVCWPARHEPRVMSTEVTDRRRPGRLFDGYALDLDGTVYLGEALLPGAASTIAAIRAAGSAVVFLTNNPLKPAAAYAAKLTGLGRAPGAADWVTPLGVLAGYLRRRHPGAA